MPNEKPGAPTEDGGKSVFCKAKAILMSFRDRPVRVRAAGQLDVCSVARDRE